MQKIGKMGACALFFLLPFIGIVFTRLVFDGDLWFILNSGRFVLENGFPYTEPFSMHEGLNFVLEQWLTDIIYWEIYVKLGAEGVLTFVIVMGFCILLIYEKICLFLSGNIVVSKVLTFFFGVATAPIFFLTRPQVISTFIFMLEVFLLLNYAKTNNKKYLCFIPVLSVLIVNLHSALWPMVFILLLPFIANYLAKNLTNIGEEYLGENFDLKPIILTFIASFFIAFINPYGFKAMAFLFTSYDPDVHGFIGEMQPMSLKIGAGFFQVYVMFFFIYLFLGIVLLSKKAAPLYLILLFSGLGFLGMLAGRNVFLFYALGTIALAYVLKDYKPKITGLDFNFIKLLPFLFLDFYVLYDIINKGEFYNMPHIFILYFILLFLALVLFVFCYGEKDNLSKIKGLLAVILPFFFIAHLSFQSKASADDYIDELYKSSIDMVLKETEPKDLIFFAGFNTGSYPEFRGIKSYIDGRPEIFAPKNSGKDFSFIEEYLNVTRGKIYYRDFVEKYNFNYMLVEEGDGILFKMLPYDKDFVLLNEEKDKNGHVYARLYKVNLQKYR